MFYKAVVIILVISFILALISLKKFNSKPDIEKVKKKLNKGRVIYQHQESS